MSTTNPAGPGRNPVVVSTETSAPALHSRSSSTALRLGSRGQWGAIAAGAFTGLAVTITMATLGAALGMTASAAAADHASDSGFGRDGAEAAAMGFSIGAGVWLLLTAAVVGLTGGGVLARLAHADRAYSPRVLGLVTWAFGLSVAMLLATSGTSGLATGLGVGGAGAAGAVANSPGLQGALTESSRRSVEDSDARASEASMGRGPAALSAEERAAAVEAAERAAKTASTAAWFALVAQLVGLGATLLAASRRKLQTEADLVVAPA